MKKKIFVVSIIILLIPSFFIYKYIKKKMSDKIVWKTTVVEKGDIDIVITSTGTVNPVNTVLVGTQISGVVSEIFVDYNSKVEKDQIIAKLDTRSLYAAVLETQSLLKKAEIQKTQNEREYERAKKLYLEKMITQVEYENAENTFETAIANCNSINASLYRTQINLSNATIKAPISGIIISRNVEVGQTVAASLNTPTLFTIANDLSQMQVEANIDEADIGYIKQGQEVEFFVDAYPEDIFNGIVKEIRLEPIIIQNVVNYIVIITTDNYDLKLMPGMTASLSIKIENRTDVLKIQTSALNFSPPEEFLKQYFNSLPDSVKANMRNRQQRNNRNENIRRIWVINNNIIKTVRIKTGLSDGSYVEILESEINIGDTVLIGYENSNNSTSQRSPFIPQRR